jgi:hypothetical protein
MSQAEALWESKSQIAGLACQDIRYKGPVNQTERQNNNNNQSTQKFRTNERLPSRATGNVRTPCRYPQMCPCVHVSRMMMLYGHELSEDSQRIRHLQNDVI